MTIRIDGTNTAANPGITGADADTGLQFGTDEVNIVTGGSTRATVDSNGRLLVGTTTAVGSSNAVVIKGTSGTSNGSVYLGNASNASTLVAGNTLGFIEYGAADGGTGAQILGVADGTWSSTSDCPTRLVFSTTADSASSPTERMRIDSSGNLKVGAGTTITPDANADDLVIDKGAADTGLSILSTTTGRIYFGDAADDEAGSIRYVHSDNSLRFETNSTQRMRITSAGDITDLLGPYNNTIATGTNLHITSAGTLKRVTSSAKYKTSIETLEDSYADNILNCRPVWYRALGDEENPEYSWYGFIAEEVAEIDPRLVQYREVEVTYDEDGSPVTTPLAEPVPEGVSYERFVPHLLNLIKRQKEAIEALETRVAQLEGGVS